MFTPSRHQGGRDASDPVGSGSDGDRGAASADPAPRARARRSRGAQRGEGGPRRRRPVRSAAHRDRRHPRHRRRAGDRCRRGRVLRERRLPVPRSGRRHRAVPPSRQERGDHLARAVLLSTCRRRRSLGHAGSCVSGRRYDAVQQRGRTGLDQRHGAVRVQRHVFAHRQDHDAGDPRLRADRAARHHVRLHGVRAPARLRHPAAGARTAQRSLVAGRVGPRRGTRARTRPGRRHPGEVDRAGVVRDRVGTASRRARSARCGSVLSA